MKKIATSILNPTVMAALESGDTSCLTPEMEQLCKEATTEEGRQRLMQQTMSSVLGSLAPGQRGAVEKMMASGDFASLLGSRKAKRAMHRASNRERAGSDISTRDRLKKKIEKRQAEAQRMHKESHNGEGAKGEGAKGEVAKGEGANGVETGADDET